MCRSMKTYLLVSVSLCLLALAGCRAAAGGGWPVDARSLSEARVWTDGLRSDRLKNSYRMKIQVKNTLISGICLLKKSDGGWRGTVMNEFGAKAFDFTVTARGCELQNLFPAIDKWYLRRTIASDMHFLVAVDDPAASFQKKTRRYEQAQTLRAVCGRKKTLVRQSDGTLTMENHAHHIVYTLQKMEE